MTVMGRRKFLALTGGAVGGLAISPIRYALAYSPVSSLSVLIQKGGMGPAAEVALDLYSKKSGIALNVTAVPWEVQYQKTMAELVARSTAFDVIPTNPGWRGAMARYLEDLNPWISERHFNADPFPRGIWAATQWGGRRIGLPFRAGISDLLFYRKDLYEKKGLRVPATIEELLYNAEALTSPQEKIYGFASQFNGGPDMIIDVQGWLMPYGARILKEPDQKDTAPFSPNGEHLIRVFKAWKTMYEKGWMPKTVVSWGFLDVLQAFQQGMLAQATIFSPRAALVEDPSKSSVAGKIGYASLFGRLPSKDLMGPRGQKGEGWAFGINQWISQERKESAFDLVQFIVGKDAQMAAALRGANGPTRRDVLTDPEFKRAYPAWEALSEALELFNPGISVPQYPILEKIIGDTVTSVLLNRETPESAARQMWTRIGDTMRKGGGIK
jgi:multiple sugar transport system substrate-binding protein